MGVPISEADTHLQRVYPDFEHVRRVMGTGLGRLFGH